MGGEEPETAPPQHSAFRETRWRRHPGPLRRRSVRPPATGRRPVRSRAARRALPAACSPPGAPLPAHRRADRGSHPGRLDRTVEGGRPLRLLARGDVLQLRGADHPRRAQAPFSRPHVVGASAARSAGAGAAGRPDGHATIARTASLPVGERSRRGSRSLRGAGARGARGDGAYRAGSLDAPRSARDEETETVAEGLGSDETASPEPRNGLRWSR